MKNTEIFDRHSGKRMLIADYAESNTQWRAITSEYALDLRNSQIPIELSGGWAHGTPMAFDYEQDERVYLCFRLFQGQYYAQICTIQDYALLPDPSFVGS